MYGLGVEDIENRDELISQARQMVEKGEGESIILDDLWGWAYVSARRFVQLFREDSPAAVFNYHSPELGFDTVSGIEVPMTAFLGTEDTGIVTDAYESMDVLDENADNCPRFDGVVLEGAEHDFSGFEDEIIDNVLELVRSES